ncbi:RidA family protein [Pandoraea anhela]|uniref:Translation-inhibition endoribonuclease n=1 Tax=Pandoraea anhela TaxID=2508295 RepID=A0A5E4R875_9BURK|nr:RidA family protein [Pandoraea anhela]VVD59011.1 translation-inhibition endoribonuclease [Pandoraea anhela]
MTDIRETVVAPPPPYAASRRVGKFVLTAGQVPRNAAREVMGDSIEAQTVAVFDNLRRALADSAANMSDVVKINVYLADISEWSRFNVEYCRQMGDLRPVRTTIGCALNGVKIEVDAIAYLGDEPQMQTIGALL